jgi:hypothetical protein
MYDYCYKFNNLAQYGAHHVDMDEKKAKLFHKGLTIQLQDHLILFPTLSYNALASATINQEVTLKACAEAEEKKTKRAMSGPSGSGVSTGAPLKYRMIYIPPTG